MQVLTHERLRHLFNYDPETGILTRRVDSSTGRHKTGERAGCAGTRFRNIWIDDKQYGEHRIIWFWMTGALPTHQIDHRNLSGLDNRWINLREATASENGMNRRGRSKSGAKGVYFQANPDKCGSKPWKVSIAKEGKAHHVGMFETIEEAQAAYAAAALRLHGEFARIA